MSSKRSGKYAASKRPKGDDTVCVKISVTDIFKIYSTIAKLTGKKIVKAQELKDAALSVNRLVNRSRPYYRHNKPTPSDICLPEITGDKTKRSLSEIIRKLKQDAADWRDKAVEIFELRD